MWGLILNMTIIPNAIYARDLSELESVNSTETVDDTENINKDNEENYATTTLNIRCYPQENIVENKDTIVKRQIITR